MGALYPRIDELRAVARAIAIAVVRQARDRGLERHIADGDIVAAVDRAMWWPEYAIPEPAN
jgi:hypothetical protein